MLSRLSIRNFSSATRRIISVNQSILPNSKYEVVEIGIENEKSLVIPLVWLRDHCRSPSSYNHSSNQRRSNASNLFDKSKLKDGQSISFNMETQTLQLLWKDGHVTEYKSNELIDWASKREENVTEEEMYKLWNRENIGKLPIMNKEGFSFAAFVELFTKYGFVMVEGIEVNAEATEEFCRTIAPIHDTFFGSFWTFSNKAEETKEIHEDSAYSDEEIGPHTDGTYFQQTPGIQVFHCLQPASKGGDTLLVDGFGIVEKMKRENKEEYERLCGTMIDHHYLEGNTSGDKLQSIAHQYSVINRFPNGKLRQIRFNPYDRAPFNVLSSEVEDAEKAVKYYEAYSTLSSLCHSSLNTLPISLRPGTVIFIDNYRVMHARTGFQGFRKMCGCYLSRDNFFAKARPFMDEKMKRNF